MSEKNLLREPQAKRFLLVRNDDETGISGTGVVAEGVEFANGRCVLGWLTPTSSINIYNNLEELVEIHGHEGRTVVRMVDKTGPSIRQKPAGPRTFFEAIFHRLRQ